MNSKTFSSVSIAHRCRGGSLGWIRFWWALTMGLSVWGSPVFAEPVIVQVSDPEISGHDTVAVTIYVGNDASLTDASDLVIDTETLVLRETGETTGIFQSGAVILTDSELPLAANNRISLAKADSFSIFYILSPLNFSISGNLKHEMGFREAWQKAWQKQHLMLLPVVHDHPDVAKVPAEARFAEINTSFIVWVISSLLACGLFWILFRRIRPHHITTELESLSKEDLLKLELNVLTEFLERHPDHPQADAVAGEIGRRFFERQDYDRAANYLEMAIKHGGEAKNPQAHYYLGHACRQLGYICDAIDEWMACYMDDPEGPLASEAFHEAQRWRAFQVVKDKVPCPECGADCRLIDFHCSRCKAALRRTIVRCGVCGKSMIKEAQLCIHCLPDDIKSEVAEGSAWPIVKTTGLDWEAKLIQNRLAAEDIPAVLTGEKGAAIPLTIGYLGEIHIRVPVSCVAEARTIVQADVPPTAEHSEPLAEKDLSDHASPEHQPDAGSPPPKWSALHSPLAWILIGFCIFMTAWFFYVMGGWTVVSTVDGEKIRERDIGVSIHEAVDLVTGLPKSGSGTQRLTMARNMEQDRLRRLEAKLLREHLIAKGTSDQEQLKMDDDALIQWGHATGRIQRSARRPRH